MMSFSGLASDARWGFEVGHHPDRLHGHRFFKNYDSATSEAARPRVTKTKEARVAAGKTLHLGSVVYETLSVIRQVFDKAFIFPMGTTAKPLEPDKYLRPTSDHTRTGLNAACNMHGEGRTAFKLGSPTLSYSLETYAEMGRRFLPAGVCSARHGRRGGVPNAPIRTMGVAVHVPPLLRYFNASEGDPTALHLYCYTCSDFGTRSPNQQDLVGLWSRRAEVINVHAHRDREDLRCEACT